jgi:hypothetical protein
MSVPLNHRILIGKQNLQECKPIRCSGQYPGQQTAPNCVAWQESPALPVTEIGNEDTSVYLQAQHARGVQAVYEVEDELVDVQEYHDKAKAQLKTASMRAC